MFPPSTLISPSAQYKSLISTSWDRSIAIHDEEKADRGVLLRRMNDGHTSDVTCSDYSDTLSLIASGSSDTTVALWDYEFARPEGICVGPTSGITAVRFIDPYPAVLAADRSCEAQ